MNLTAHAAAHALPDLGWSVSQYFDGPWVLLAWAEIDERPGHVSLWLTFHDDATLRDWSLYRVAILPDREQPQVVQKLEDLPAPDLWVLPTPTQVHQLLDRAGIEGRGQVLCPTRQRLQDDCGDWLAVV